MSGQETNKMCLQAIKGHLRTCLFGQQPVYIEPLKKSVNEVTRSLYVLRRIGADIHKKRLFLELLTRNRKEGTRPF